MNRSSRVTECKVLDLYFQGHLRDEIPEMVGVAPRTVSEVINLVGKLDVSSGTFG